MQTGLFPDISVYAAKRDLLFGNGTALKGFSLYVIILKNKSEFGGEYMKIVQVANDEEKKAVAKSLGEALKENRIRCQMTQEFVAETLGVSRQSVSKWENGVSHS